MTPLHFPEHWASTLYGDLQLSVWMNALGRKTYYRMDYGTKQAGLEKFLVQQMAEGRLIYVGRSPGGRNREVGSRFGNPDAEMLQERFRKQKSGLAAWQ
jgi:hypothetical protein